MNKQLEEMYAEYEDDTLERIHFSIKEILDLLYDFDESLAKDYEHDFRVIEESIKDDYYSQLERY